MVICWTSPTVHVESSHQASWCEGPRRSVSCASTSISHKSIVDFHSSLTPRLTEEPFVCAWVRNLSQVLFQVFQELVTLNGHLQAMCHQSHKFSCSRMRFTRILWWAMLFRISNVMQNMISIIRESYLFHTFLGLELPARPRLWVLWMHELVHATEACCGMTAHAKGSKLTALFAAATHCIQSWASCTQSDKVQDLLDLPAYYDRMATTWFGSSCPLTGSLCSFSPLPSC